MIMEAHEGLSSRVDAGIDRSTTIIEEFYALVSKHAVAHRDLHFYAEKLSLTLPYLTTLLRKKNREICLEMDQSYCHTTGKILTKNIGFINQRGESSTQFSGSKLVLSLF